MSNIITIETDIEPPLVAVALSDWNALNQAYDAALARAEAAEKELERLTQRYQMAIERAHIAERRVFELEARLIDVDMAQISTANELEAIAASLGLTYDAWPGFAPILQDIEMRLAEQGWRPVDDLDLDRGSDVDILARGHYDPEMGGVMLDSRDFLLSDGEDFIAWRPRTTSPIDPPAPA